MEEVREFKNPEQKFGEVVNCKRLAVREKPDVSSNMITAIDVKSKIEITSSRQNSDWVKIKTSDGISGFCMSKYISIKTKE